MTEHLLDEAASLTVLLAAKSLNGQLQVFGHHSPRLSWNVTNLLIGDTTRDFYWSMGCAHTSQKRVMWWGWLFWQKKLAENLA